MPKPRPRPTVELSWKQKSLRTLTDLREFRAAWDKALLEGADNATFTRISAKIVSRVVYELPLDYIQQRIER